MGRGFGPGTPKMKPPPPSKPRNGGQTGKGANSETSFKPAAPKPKDESDESESDYSDVEEDDGGDDEEVYDWFAFDTKAGMQSLENKTEEQEQAKTPSKTQDPQLRSEIDDMLRDSDDESDESETYDLLDGEDEEVYDWTSMNTAAGLQEIEKKENINSAPDESTVKETPSAQPSAPKTPKILTQPISTPKPNRPSNAPSMPRIPQSPATPGPAPASDQGTPTVKDTTRVKRKKASLPTTKPMNAHGSWLTNRYIVNNYILLDALGQGSYAEVRLCKEKVRWRIKHYIARTGGP